MKKIRSDSAIYRIFCRQSIKVKKPIDTKQFPTQINIKTKVKVGKKQKIKQIKNSVIIRIILS